MTLNKRKLRKWGESMRVLFTKEQERVFLERFGEEPWPYEWSEQDIAVQIRNYLGWGEFEKPSHSNRSIRDDDEQLPEFFAEDDVQF